MSDEKPESVDSHMVSDCISGPLGLEQGVRRAPGREIDRLVLSADCVDELSDHVGGVSRDVPQLEIATAALARVNREAGTDLATHLHFRVRGVADDAQHYCAVVGVPEGGKKPPVGFIAALEPKAKG